jgi:hypothetical protein
MNSMVYSVIKVSFTINQRYIIENFCVNKDMPELKCDGKCYLADQIKAEKERQESTPAFIFNPDFGVYIPISTFSVFHPKNTIEPLAHKSFYQYWFGQTVSKEIEHPPKG